MKAMQPNNGFDLNKEQLELASFLNQGRLIEFYDFEGVRFGIRSLNPNELDQLALYFKSKPLDDVLHDTEAPLLFCKKTIYSLNGKVLDSGEKEEFIDSLHQDLIQLLFSQWRELQSRVEDVGDSLEDYCGSLQSRMKYKICKLFQKPPTHPYIRNMDPITQAWLFRNIVEDEKDLSNMLYDKLEYAVSFWDPKNVEKQRKWRLRSQGIKIDDPDTKESTNFDQELIDELAAMDPNIDTSKIKTLDDYINFAPVAPFEEEIEKTKNSITKYDDEEKQTLITWLERQKGLPLTQTEREITIYKLDNGQVINLKQITDEAADLELANADSSLEILNSLPNLDDI
jgi:hypothetical protein